MIAGVMLVGWLVVALYEWATTRELPHYGRGLPPRYYVPQVSLPPPRPLEQLPAQRSGYPAADRRRPGDLDRVARDARRDVRGLAGRPGRRDGAAPSPGEDTMSSTTSCSPPPRRSCPENTWIELDPVAEGRSRDADPVAGSRSCARGGRGARAARGRARGRGGTGEPEPVAAVPEVEPEVEPEPRRASRRQSSRLVAPAPPVVVAEPELVEARPPENVADEAVLACSSVAEPDGGPPTARGGRSADGLDVARRGPTAAPSWPSRRARGARA